tara:strand:+ start:243 stop:410 length:168 start_codon:yes stop_codon:yes gene_type:complete
MEEAKYQELKLRLAAIKKQGTTNYVSTTVEERRNKELARRDKAGEPHLKGQKKKK